MILIAKLQYLLENLLSKNKSTVHDNTIKGQNTSEYQKYGKFNLPEPVGPIIRILLFSSSTASLSMALVLSLPEFTADLTFQVVTYIRIINRYVCKKTE